MESSDIWTAKRVAGLLARTIGEERAQAAVEQAVVELRYDPEALTREQCMNILELLAHQEGIMGITAVFAKSRLHLSST